MNTATTTLEKVRRLEVYLTENTTKSDSLLALGVDKLFERERARLAVQQERLRREVVGFEQQYGISSAVFRQRYDAGDVGDDLDYIEWSATLEMLKNLNRRLEILDMSGA